MADNIFRRDAFAAKAFYLFNLRGSQSGCISKNFIDSRFSFLIYPMHNIYLRQRRIHISKLILPTTFYLD
jgi:hypothetical protein